MILNACRRNISGNHTKNGRGQRDVKGGKVPILHLNWWNDNVTRLWWIIIWKATIKNYKKTHKKALQIKETYPSPTFKYHKWRQEKENREIKSESINRKQI